MGEHGGFTVVDWHAVEDGPLVTDMVCDCGHEQTHTEPDVGVDEAEFAWTCEGCDTTHWVHVGRPEATDG